MSDVFIICAVLAGGIGVVGLAVALFGVRNRVVGACAMGRPTPVTLAGRDTAGPVTLQPP